MTAIVGIETDGRVLLGADSAVTWGDTLVTCKQPKVWTIGDIVIGVAGDSRACDVVRYYLIKMKQFDGIDAAAWAARELASAFKAAMKEVGQSDNSCDMILGVGTKLLGIDENGGVVAFSERYGAIGAGSPYALGSLYATDTSMTLSPRNRMVTALEAAALYCPSVRGPWVFAPAEYP